MLATLSLGLNVGTAPTTTTARVSSASMMVKPLGSDFLYDPPKAGGLGANFAANMGDSASYVVEAGKEPTHKARITPATPKSEFSEFLHDAPKAGGLGANFAANMGDSASYIVEPGKEPTQKARITPATPSSQYSSFLSSNEPVA